MSTNNQRRVPASCPDCGSAESFASKTRGVNRREFLAAGSAAALAIGTAPLWAEAADTASSASSPESLVKVLFDKLSDKQKKDLCFAWDYQHPKMGLLRSRVSNNWHITAPSLNSDYFSKEQRAIVRSIFEGIIQPDWHKRIDKQLEDDAGGFGEHQNIAIFGTPGEGKYEFVMTGRHMTMRCDGNSSDHVAFGGPIFYGHDPLGTFNEDADHPQNIYWHQALEANKVFEMLDGKQRKLALVPKMPKEEAVSFHGTSGGIQGIPLTEMSSDQKEVVQKVLQKLIDPYRQSDRDEVVACLKAQGGLDKCSLAFYQDGDIGNDQVWDCWRLEGPAFVWYFRGKPHVHVWVNVADDPNVKTNA
jgi:Protein of unknown function (DUF3500)